MKKGHISESVNLRQKAEEFLNTSTSLSVSKTNQTSNLSEAETMKLIHEIEVYHIELELQNEELMLARSKVVEEDEKYSELYDFAPSGYFTLSKECVIADINLFGSLLLGKERSKLKNCRFDGFISDNTKSIFSLFFEKLFESKTKETCEVALSAEGKSLTYVILSGIVDKNPEYCLVTAIDITERRQTEEKLKESISMYKLLSENVRDVVWLMDFDLRTTYISPSAERLRGYTFEEHEQMSLEQNLTPESVELAMTVFSEEMAKLKADEKNSFNRTLDLELYCKDGSTVWLENTFTLIRDENGTPVSILGEGRDITERRKAQEELKKNLEEMQRFHRLTVERELFMIEIKKEVNELLRKSGKAEKYRIVE